MGNHTQTGTPWIKTPRGSKEKHCGKEAAYSFLSLSFWGDKELAGTLHRIAFLFQQPLPWNQINTLLKFRAEREAMMSALSSTVNSFSHVFAACLLHSLSLSLIFLKIVAKHTWDLPFKSFCTCRSVASSTFTLCATILTSYLQNLLLFSDWTSTSPKSLLLIPAFSQPLETTVILCAWVGFF